MFSIAPPFEPAGDDEPASLESSTLAASPIALLPIADQWINSGSVDRVVELGVAALEIDQSYTFTASLWSAELELDSSWDFGSSGGGQFENWYRQGLHERWLTSASSLGWHYITPAGSLYRWAGTYDPANDPLEAQLSPFAYADTSQLYAAQERGPAATLTIVGNQLIIDPRDDFAGVFHVTVTVDAGQGNSDAETFAVTVANDGVAPYVIEKSPEAVTISSDATGVDVTFSEAVVGVDASDLQLSGPGAAVAQVGKPIYLGGHQWRFPVSGLVSGTVHAALGNQPADIQDAARNDLLPVSWTFDVHFNQPPLLTAIADQVLPPGTLEAVIDLAAIDANPLDQLTYTVSGQSIEYYLDQTLELQFAGGDEYLDYLGLGEKWLRAPAAVPGGPLRWYYITPDGRFYRWAGSRNPVEDELLERLSPAVHADTALLYGAAANQPPAELSIVGNELTIKPHDSFLGRFVVTVTVDDGWQGRDSQAFFVSIQPPQSVTSGPPQLAPIPDQRLSTTQGSLQVELHVESADAGDSGDSLSFSVTGHSLEYQLRQAHALHFGGSYYQNYLGLNEKWLASGTSPSGWCYLTPDGQLWQWGGDADVADDVRLAQLSPDIWWQPTLLHAAPSNVPPAGLSLSGKWLTIEPLDHFVGEFYVSVTVRNADGAAATQQFTVLVT